MVPRFGWCCSEWEAPTPASQWSAADRPYNPATCKAGRHREVGGPSGGWQSASSWRVSGSRAAAATRARATQALRPEPVGAPRRRNRGQNKRVGVERDFQHKHGRRRNAVDVLTPRCQQNRELVVLATHAITPTVQLPTGVVPARPGVTRYTPRPPASRWHASHPPGHLRLGGQ